MYDLRFTHDYIGPTIIPVLQKNTLSLSDNIITSPKLSREQMAKLRLDSEHCNTKLHASNHDGARSLFSYSLPRWN